MNRFAPLAIAALFAAGTSVAVAEQQLDTGNLASGPVQMTDAQLDQVSAGAPNFNNLVSVDVSNVANNLNAQVAVPVNAAVAVGAIGILSRQSVDPTTATAPGRLDIRR